MKIILQLFLIVILPISLLLIDSIPPLIKGLIVIMTVAALIFLIMKEKFSIKTLGLRTDNLKKTFPSYALFTFIGIIALFFLAKILEKQPLSHWWTYNHLQWFFLPISFIQELGVRAFFQTKLQKRMRPIYAILIISILYSWMHILWKDPLILFMTFVGGLSWGYLWYKYPNLILSTLSHSVINFLAVYLNFFPWLPTKYFLLH